MSTEAIDFKQLLTSEKMKAITLKKYIPCKSWDVYNMLQDLRHVALIDLRPYAEFSEGYIRDSYNFNVTVKDSLIGVIEYLNKCSKKAEENELKYESKKIRRVIVIPPARNEEAYKTSFEAVLALAASYEIDLDKVYIMTDSIADFRMEFDFLCLNAEDKKQVQAANDMPNKSEALKQPAMKKLLFAHSRFPVMLLETQLFVGTGFNMNSDKQMRELKIKSAIHFDTYPVVKGEDCPEETTFQRKTMPELEVLSIKVNVQKYIDFDSIVEQIRELPSPRLLCCSQNMKISSTFAIAYLMVVQKMDVNKASLIVFSKIGSTEADKLIFAQLMLYQPDDKKRFIKI
jgi:rhodanese-related sulfurtransferase